jgi:hypothetical protein
LLALLSDFGLLAGVFLAALLAVDLALLAGAFFALLAGASFSLGAVSFLTLPSFSAAAGFYSAGAGDQSRGA